MWPRISLRGGVAVELLEMKDVEIPQQMQRVMAMEAEAMREKRAIYSCLVHADQQSHMALTMYEFIEVRFRALTCK